jgi:hypothetical protein
MSQPNMKHTLTLLTTLLLAPLAALHATDIELTETVQLPECHSVNWVRDWVKNHPEVVGGGWEQLHDASRPTAVKAAPRSWVWNISEAQWREAVKQKGEGKREEVKLQLWLPAGVEVIKGVVAISGHGSGESLYRDPELRKICERTAPRDLQIHWQPDATRLLAEELALPASQRVWREDEAPGVGTRAVVSLRSFQRRRFLRAVRRRAE